MSEQKVARVGCGSAYDGDRLDWSVDLAKSGAVSYLSFDCLAEGTMTAAQLRRNEDPSVGYAMNLLPVIESFEAFLGNGLKIIGNFGVSNTEAAVQATVDLLRQLGRYGIRVGAVHGDDIRTKAFELDLDLPDMGCKLSEVGKPVVSVNAYTGAGEMMSLLTGGADFVLGGRTADVSLYVAPICYEMGWDLDDLDRLARASAAGHLLECGILVSGGRLANPPRHMLKNAVRIGMPYAEISHDEIIISKNPNSGGVVDIRTVKMQLGYEIHDPANYLTPDVTLDVSNAAVEQVDVDRVRVTGVRGKPRPDTLKVLVGLDLGWRVTSEVSLGGPGCLERADFARELLEARCAEFRGDIDDLRVDLIGMNSLFGDQIKAGAPAEVRLRFAARCSERHVAAAFHHEAKHLGMSIAGATASAPRLERFFGVTPAFVPRSAVSLEQELVTV
jgi:hypothetical protein